ncbi:MAG: hypothetical protein IPP56_11535 [Bacteroidetes bacterium]|nr:hypothetical protein [Bacteroidota bacterium]
MKTILAVFVFCFVALFPATQLLAQDDKTEQLAMQYYSQGEFEKALALYEKLFNRNPDELNYYQHYLDCLLSTKDFKTAEKLAKNRCVATRRNCNTVLM